MVVRIVVGARYGVVVVVLGVVVLGVVRSVVSAWVVVLVLK